MPGYKCGAAATQSPALRSVYPSGELLATTSAPIPPVAPARGRRQSRRGGQVESHVDRLSESLRGQSIDTNAWRRNPERGEPMGMMELVGDMRNDHLRNAGAQRARCGARATVMHDRGN